MLLSNFILTTSGGLYVVLIELTFIVEFRKGFCCPSDKVVVFARFSDWLCGIKVIPETIVVVVPTVVVVMVERLGLFEPIGMLVVNLTVVALALLSEKAFEPAEYTFVDKNKTNKADIIIAISSLYLIPAP